jgi:hypothetical protein
MAAFSRRYLAHGAVHKGILNGRRGRPLAGPFRLGLVLGPPQEFGCVLLVPEALAEKCK